MMLHPLYGVLIALGVLAPCLALGLRLCAALSLDYAHSAFERGLIAFGLGSGVVSLTMFGLGSAGLLYAPLTAALLTAGLLYGWRDALTWFRLALTECLQLARQKARLRSMLVILCCFIGLNGLAALAPPFDVDALTYHLAVPHIYALHHRIVQLPSIYHSYFPFGIQMLYVACMIFDSPLAAQCLHAAFGLAAAGMVGVIARRFYGRHTACFAMILFYTLPDVSAEISSARIDLGTSFYALLALSQLLHYCRSAAPDRKMAFFTGCFAGLCAGTKYTALIIPPVISAVAFLFSPRPFSMRIRYSVAVSLVAITVAAPWYLRNIVWIGNPVFPFLTSVFPSEIAVAEFIQRDNWNYATVPRTIWNFARSPWLLLIDHDAFASNQIGPLFLAYLPIYALTKWRRLKRFDVLIGFGLFWAPFWFWTSPLVRFFFAPIALCCIPLAQALRVGMRYSRWFRRGTLSSVFLWLTFCFISNIRYHGVLIAVVLGGVSVDTFLNSTSMFQAYHYEDFQAINSKEEIRKILLHGTHGLFIDRPFELAATWAAAHQALVEKCEPGEVNAVLRKSGITHLLLNADAASFSERDRRLWACLQQTYGKIAADMPIYQRNTIKLFDITDGKF